MAKTIATVLGAGFLLVGLVGFVAPGLLGMHLSVTHDIVHLVSGAASLYFGLKGTMSQARMFCLVFGAVYALLGVLGFVLGDTGTVTAGMPGMSPDPNLWKVLPDVLELGRMDHIVHILLGAIYLVGGLITKADVARATS